MTQENLFLELFMDILRGGVLHKIRDVIRSRLSDVKGLSREDELFVLDLIKDDKFLAMLSVNLLDNPDKELQERAGQRLSDLSAKDQAASRYIGLLGSRLRLTDQIDRYHEFLLHSTDEELIKIGYQILDQYLLTNRNADDKWDFACGLLNVAATEEENDIMRLLRIINKESIEAAAQKREEMERHADIAVTMQLVFRDLYGDSSYDCADDFLGYLRKKSQSEHQVFFKRVHEQYYADKDSLLPIMKQGFDIDCGRNTRKFFKKHGLL